ncbi:MAG: hypothetical protein E5X11_31750, partial [Mesorhizobium sp.]
VEEAIDAQGFPEFWRAPEIDGQPGAQNYSGKKWIFPGVRRRSHAERYFVLCIHDRAWPRMPGDFRKFEREASMTRTPGFNTLAVHAGAKPD